MLHEFGGHHLRRGDPGDDASVLISGVIMYSDTAYIRTMKCEGVFIPHCVLITGVPL